MIDHIGITVSNYQKSVDFYRKALQPLGYELLMEVQGFAGFGLKNAGGPIANFWIHEGQVSAEDGSLVHVAFSASKRKIVDDFYQAAMTAGGKDHGKPGIREIYHPNYYGAFVLDPDGHNIEAVCHHPE